MSYDKKELMNLIQLILDEEANNSQIDQLDNLLKDNKEAQQLYLEMIDLHIELDTQPYDQIKGVHTLTKRKSPIFFILATAASIIFIFSLTSSPTPKKADSFFAKIAKSKNAEFKDGVKCIDGQTFTKETIELAQGIIGLEFANGAHLTVEAPARFTILSPSLTRFYSGKMVAYVPKKAQGFTVLLNDRKIIDLGTRFALDLSSKNRQMQILEGSVATVSNDSKGNRIFEQAQAVELITNADSPFRDIELDYKTFQKARNFYLPVATLFTFDRDLQGWTQTANGGYYDRGDKPSTVRTKGNYQFSQSRDPRLSNINKIGSYTTKAFKPHSASGRIIARPFFARDLNEKVLILTSPAFQLTPSSGDISVYLSGGIGEAETIRCTLEELLKKGVKTGFLGIALRRLSDNKYVASARRLARTHKDFYQWEKVEILSDELDQVIKDSPNNEQYVLDLIDSFSNKEQYWEWIAMDSVSIPAKIKQ